MDEQKDAAQASSWVGRATRPSLSIVADTVQRIVPFGWDAKDRTYFVLDDNRLYRQTDAPPPPAAPAKPKKNSKKAKAALRASKRRKLSETMESEVEAQAEVLDQPQEDNGLGGSTWECLAVTLDEMNNFLRTIEKSRDLNEKTLRKQIIDQLLLLVEKEDEARKRKVAQKERELLNAEKLATAKRSSRIAGRLEQQRQEEEVREAERKRQQDLAMAKKEQEKWTNLEKERESRMMTREQRVREREARRILQEEELASLSEDSKKVESGEARLSERHLKAEIERKKQALEELVEEDEDWIFDCICGAYGQIDDGTHSIACEKCNIWQHSKCVGVSQSEADRDDFHFICSTCRRRAEDAQRAKHQPSIKIKLTPAGSSATIGPNVNTKPAVIIKQPPTNGTMSSASTHNTNQAKKNTAMPQMHVFHTNGQPQLTPGSSTPSAPSSHQSTSPVNQLHNTYQAYSQEARPTSSHNSAAPSFINYHPNTYQYHPTNSRPTSSNAPTAPPFSPQQNNNRSYAPSPARPVSNDPRMAHETTATVSNGYSSPYARPPSSPNHFAATPNRNADMTATGQPSFGNGGARRSSFDRSSRTLGGPVLTPMNYTSTTTSDNVSGSPPAQPNHAPNRAYKATMSSATGPQSGLMQTPTMQNGHTYDSAHVSALPPAAAGISPTKHSPPRAAAMSGNATGATPSILPPVASFTPSPPIQNLSPPVKSSPPTQPMQHGPPFVS